MTRLLSFWFCLISSRPLCKEPSLVNFETSVRTKVSRDVVWRWMIRYCTLEFLQNILELVECHKYLQLRVSRLVENGVNLSYNGRDKDEYLSF